FASRNWSRAWRAPGMTRLRRRMHQGGSTILPSPMRSPATRTGPLTRRRTEMTDPREQAENRAIVEAWLDDDSELRIPDTRWGRALYAALRSLLSAPQADSAVTALIKIRDEGRAVLAVSDRATRIGTHYHGCWVNHRDCFAWGIAKQA